ncbi:MAG: hypothetical protein FJY56_11785 [Betaproteobacteria bacterium]|nr:hypothetical protein [Betaproteobacteria bacterium]
MNVHVRKYGARIEFDDNDTFTYDEELAAMGKELQTMELLIVSRRLRGMAAVPERLDEDGEFDDFDPSAFVERTYQ